MKRIENKTFGEERALYGLQDALVYNCVFDGKEDGESALKESRDVTVEKCKFNLRYPLWHCEGFEVKDSTMSLTVRAPLWYAKNGSFSNCQIEAPKMFRECNNISFDNCNISSTEFGWRNNDAVITNSTLSSDYFMFESKNVSLKNCNFVGKYSFQYNENLLIENCKLDTKDAFWHVNNCTVINCEIKGEYLAWYSNNLTFINCKIIGTQPLCYCKNLKLVNCEMVDCDLSFEYSEVEADVNGTITSVKNPLSGRIAANDYGEIILKDSIYDNKCEIVRK